MSPRFVDDGLLRAALGALRRAHHYAMDAGADVWDFAVELDEFRRSRISKSELRWLVRRGFAMHACELSDSRTSQRQFRSASLSSFSERSCFIITPDGLAFVQNYEELLPTWNGRRPTADAQLTPDQNSAHLLLPTAALADKPQWDPHKCELRLGGRLVKRFRSPAPNQQLVLQAFEIESWPIRIDDPLPLMAEQCPKRRLHDAIKCLNRHQVHGLIHFGGDGSGRGVLWERTA
jgi:hypothetical protein